MKNFLLALLLIFTSTQIYAQISSNTLFTKRDVINIVLSGNSDYYYNHEIQKGQSLYSLSKIFNIELRRLYQVNDLKEGATISIGQRIKIPIEDEYLFKGVSLSGLENGHYIPVYYQTKPKDNLFRIARIYFNQPTQDLVSRNKLADNNLSLGQKLLIGWWPIDGEAPMVNEDFTEEFVEDFDDDDMENRENVEDKNINMETIPALDSLEQELYPEGFNISLLGTLTYTKSMKQVTKSEVAHWDKTMPDNGMVYVLHQDAILESYIEMYNPILKRSVRAKVIGRIPYGAYTKDVRLVLSPRTAKQLGALDGRFKVEVKALVYGEG